MRISDWSSDVCSSDLKPVTPAIGSCRRAVTSMVRITCRPAPQGCLPARTALTVPSASKPARPCRAALTDSAKPQTDQNGLRMPTSFKTIRARAEKRKGGAAALKKLLPPPLDNKKLAKLKDDRGLAEMARRVFSAGFVWSVIENKWDGFEAAFLGFEPRKLLHKPDEFWEKLTADKRILRNPTKIRSVREKIGRAEWRARVGK